MNADKLSKRLERVADFVPKGSKTADIGSDHAYLPCYLVKKDVIPFAIAGEVAEGPFQSAAGQVLAEGLVEQVSVRKGDGLDVLNPGEAECITIAGMGGALIASILERGKDKLDNVKRLILQPNVSAISIREWFMENGWELVEEDILEEDGKIYEVLVGEKGDPSLPYKDMQNKGLLFGPFLMKKVNEAFKKKWALEKDNWEKILSQLEKAAQTEETLRKKQELQQKIKWAEEVL
ncbi:tRNA (adenine(22)-N(1))-methyltransferase [Neobacillus terrae]|uniref:tRNA (adenine(22)-N(1))-methyltransferase n=1 Tax=Neobacillus terrae TaxID=3034837 RepID=UPI00140DEBF0|nr:tRNA (adenine(22)-N(1))-methyltransferase TrmK [Neobacillus terrae]NHM30342.1 tRNA (adenine-N(1))-methyltransferase [Neobacillus terrae]